MPFSTRQQKLYKLCRGYKILGPRLTKYCWGRVPGGVDADEYCEMSVMGTSCTKVVELNYFSTNFLKIEFEVWIEQYIRQLISNHKIVV